MFESYDFKLIQYSLASLIGVLVFSAAPISYSEAIIPVPCRSGNPNDVDGDDIPDQMEASGIDANNDGIIDIDLRSRQANPLHKDLFLEIDYMQYHQPYSDVIENVIDAFNRAPVCNPDGSNGIRLHVQLDEQIPHRDSIIISEAINGRKIDTWSGFDSLKSKHFGTVTERMQNNKDLLLDAKGLVYHYLIIGHTWDNRGNSGVSKGIPAMDFIVSLGKFRTTDPQTGHVTGSPSQQEGTIMHELGHNLNLHHGGGDDINCKPNYLSVMNYMFQFPSLVSNRPLDYSRSLLLPLRESVLDESAGISISEPEGLRTIYGPPEELTVTTGSDIDWNRDFDFVDTGVGEDINFLSSVSPCGASPDQALLSHDDWDNLIYDITLHERNNDVMTVAGAMDLNQSGVMPDGPSNQSTSLNDELTYDDVKKMNIALISSINNAVQGLANPASELEVDNSSLVTSFSDVENEAPIGDIGVFYANKLGFGEGSESALMDLPPTINDTSIVGLIRSDSPDQAIAGLEELLSTMDSSFGGAQSDDMIANPNSQREIAGLINNAIDALKTQSCSYENCIVTAKAANSTIEY